MRKLGSVLLFVLILPVAGAVLPAQQSARAQYRQDACRDPRTMTVQVQSKTPGADVSVDDRLVGQTPATVCLEAGRHRVTVARRGSFGSSHPWELELETLPGSTVVLDANLDQGFAGLPREQLYRASVAVVWALGGIEDDKPCRRALDEYQGNFGSVSAEARELIESTYRDLMGGCSGDDPRGEVRNRVRRDFLGRRMEINY